MYWDWASFSVDSVCLSVLMGNFSVSSSCTSGKKKTEKETLILFWKETLHIQQKTKKKKNENVLHLISRKCKALRDC